MACTGTEHVGVAEIADRLDVRPQTVAMWIWRDTQGNGPGLPAPCGCMVSRQEARLWQEVEAWAKKTGHPKSRGGGRALKDADS